MVKKINNCRLCNSQELVTILDIGEQAFTGVFPKSKTEIVPTGHLMLVKCSICGLVQLMHSYDLEQLYGDGYGYRSGLNNSMIRHLKNKVKIVQGFIVPERNEYVIDIGSNDGTLLAFYPENEAALIGFDPSAERFKKYYRQDIKLITDFFSAAKFKEKFGESKTKIVTSIAMFYDLEDPLDFVRQVCSILADDGIWHFEQSYLPSMLETNAYDTVCHEHLEYYSLKQIKWMAGRAGLKIIDVEKNRINGGSFAVTVAKQASPYREANQVVNDMLCKENEIELDNVDTYKAFELRVKKQRDELIWLLRKLKDENKKVYGYGASTKGNVVLQYCGIDDSLIPYIAEVNPDKFGHYTPGTKIPILSEKDVHAMKPDYLLVLPWHFKDNILEREKEYLARGGKFIFPLPNIEVVGE